MKRGYRQVPGAEEKSQTTHGLTIIFTISLLLLRDEQKSDRGVRRACLLFVVLNFWSISPFFPGVDFIREKTTQYFQYLNHREAVVRCSVERGGLGSLCRAFPLEHVML